MKGHVLSFNWMHGRGGHYTIFLVCQDYQKYCMRYSSSRWQPPFLRCFCHYDDVCKTTISKNIANLYHRGFYFITLHIYLLLLVAQDKKNGLHMCGEFGFPCKQAEDGKNGQAALEDAQWHLKVGSALQRGWPIILGENSFTLCV